MKQSFWFGTTFFAVSLFATLTAHAADQPPAGSLFFTPDEAKQIDILANKDHAAVQPDIHLGAVMYYGSGNWTLWLQGERWVPGTDRADLHVLDVQPGEVKLALVVSRDAPPKEIILKPHQTYQIATGNIVEGGP